MRIDDLEGVAERLGREWPPSARLLATIGAQPAPESTHTVLRIDVDGEPCALKIFESWERGEPEREWALLELLAGTDLAPPPVWRSPLGTRPIVVSRWIAGTPMGGRAIEDDEIEAIASAHARVHALVPPASLPPAISCAARVVHRISEAWDGLGGFAKELDLSAAVLRRVDGAPFAASDAVRRLIADTPKVVTRGDTNLRNYLGGARRLRMLDFEDAGVAEVEIELADTIEHFANRGRGMERLVTRFTVDEDTLRTAQGLVAEFWFVILIGRAARGLGMTPPTTAEEQLARILQLGVL